MLVNWKFAGYVSINMNECDMVRSVDDWIEDN